jgi:hypothetical protein
MEVESGRLGAVRQSIERGDRAALGYPLQPRIPVECPFMAEPDRALDSWRPAVPSQGTPNHAAGLSGSALSSMGEWRMPAPRRSRRIYASGRQPRINLPAATSSPWSMRPWEYVPQVRRGGHGLPRSHGPWNRSHRRPPVNEWLTGQRWAEPRLLGWWLQPLARNGCPNHFEGRLGKAVRTVTHGGRHDSQTPAVRKTPVIPPGRRSGASLDPAAVARPGPPPVRKLLHRAGRAMAVVAAGRARVAIAVLVCDTLSRQRVQHRRRDGSIGDWSPRRLGRCGAQSRSKARL